MGGRFGRCAVPTFPHPLSLASLSLSLSLSLPSLTPLPSDPDRRPLKEGGEREFVLTGGAKNAVVAVERYYSNNVTDKEKQMAINLFLGV